MKSEFLLMLVALLFLVGAAVLLKAGGKKQVHVQRKDLMTKNELAFWRLLVPAVAPLHVGPQVAMSALVTTANGLNQSARTTARNSFDRKCVDFVLFDDAGVVQLVVELDDATHNADRDGARDRMTEQAGYRTLRVRRREVASSDALAAMIRTKLAPVPSEQPG